MWQLIFFLQFNANLAWRRPRYCQFILYIIYLKHHKGWQVLPAGKLLTWHQCCARQETIPIYAVAGAVKLYTFSSLKSEWPNSGFNQEWRDKSCNWVEAAIHIVHTQYDGTVSRLLWYNQMIAKKLVQTIQVQTQ